MHVEYYNQELFHIPCTQQDTDTVKGVTGGFIDLAVM